jgi:lantibiotic leader peptide-processing serine protease
MMRNTLKKSAWILFISSVFGLSGYSSVQAETSDNYTFLLNDPQQVNNFLQELDVDDKDVNVTVIEEIGLVYIESKGSNKNLEQELTAYSKKLDSYISAEGELPELKISSDKPSVTDVKDIKEEKVVEPQNPSLVSPYFKPFNWYLEDVTNNYQSHLINTGKNTSIALIDSGIDKEHPLLAHKINLSLGKNYTSDVSGVDDEMGYGTSVAGILTSIAPDMTIVPYKVLGAKDGESIWVLEAIVDAVNDGNDILNLSLGTYKLKSNKEDQVLIEAYEAAIKYANEHGVVVVAAAGNLSKDLDELNKNDEIYLPGNLESVITVSSNTNVNTKSSHSNYGNNVDFSAPGEI